MRIVVTHPDPDARAEWTAELGRLLPAASVHEDRPGAAPGEPFADYAIGWATPADFFDRHPRLRAYFSAGAGVDHLLRHPALPDGLALVRLEDAGMAAQMAEYCCHEVFRLRARHPEYEALQRERRWVELAPRPYASLRIGVLGMGVLGAHVARTLHGFGYAVEGFARQARTLDGIPVRSPDSPGGLAGFLARSDVLVLLAPRTADTEGLIDAAALAALPPGAWLINIARGALVDEPALLAALDAGRLAGATLDVFATEPLPPDSPFWAHPRVRITPHVAAMTLVPESARQVADKIGRLARGETVSGLIDRTRGY